MNETENTITPSLRRKLHIFELPADIGRRLGQFRVNSRLITTFPSIMAELSLRIIVIRAEMRFDDLSIHYSALSPLFDPVEECQIPPHYLIDAERVIATSGEIDFFMWSANRLNSGDHIESSCRKAATILDFELRELRAEQAKG